MDQYGSVASGEPGSCAADARNHTDSHLTFHFRPPLAVDL